MSKTTIVYKTDGAGALVEKVEIKGGLKYAAPSYDSEIDKPMHQRVLDIYKDLESNGKLGPNDCEVSKSYTRKIHEEALARES